MEDPLLLLEMRAHWMPNMSIANPQPCNDLHITHGLMDNVPGNSYVVKASGFPPTGHPDDFWVLFGLTPEAKQHQISLTERKVLRARAPVIENVFIEQRIKLMERDVQVSSSFSFGKKLLGWFERSSHSFCCPYPLQECGGARMLYRLCGF
jgi:hypothetical protein